MAGISDIEWTNATWNPVTGCTKISSGCDNCYAERIAERFRGVEGHPFENGFDLTLRPERLEQPLHWNKSKMIFVNSMSDLFHKDIPISFIDKVFDTMEKADQHIFQVLSKRSSLMRKFINNRYNFEKVPEHIWLGVSIEDGSKLSRIDHLKETNAAVRFLSIEPLLGRVGQIDLDEIHWVIVGGESGPKARPIEVDWVREIKSQCSEMEVPFFFKQWGGFRPKSGGRLLDGMEWNGFPKLSSKVINPDILFKAASV